MSLTTNAYIQWQEQQLEPDYRMSNQGGMPRNKGGVHLWDEFKKMQDRNQQMLEDEMRRWEEGLEEKNK